MAERVNRNSEVQMHGPVSSRYWHLKGARKDFEPLLIIGGAFQTKHSLIKFAEFFADSGDVILVDLPGTGKTAILPADVGVDFFADCIAQLLDRLQVTRINIVGVSLGSAIAYTFAQRHPERVENVILIGTISHANQHIEAALEAMFAAVERGDKEAFANTVSEVVMNHAQRERIIEFERGERLLRSALSRMGDHENQQFLVNGRRILVHRRLDTSTPVQARTLVVTGEHDSLTTPEHCREVAETIDHSFLVTVRGADHMLPLERFDVCVGLANSFIRGQDPKESPDFATVLQIGKGRPKRKSVAPAPAPAPVEPAAPSRPSKPRSTRPFSPKKLPE